MILWYNFNIMTTFHIITIFPDLIKPYVQESILGRAIKNKKISVKVYDLRDFSLDKHHKIDSKPYGGGPGMVFEADPILRAVKKITGRKKKVKVIIFSPSAKVLSNSLAKNWVSTYRDIILIAGRYEGIDERVKKILQAEEISLGNYVLTGGELPALVLLDVASRQVTGVLGNLESIEENRVSSREVYTRPEVITYNHKKYRVPKVLLSGDHKKIEAWRLKRRSV